MSVNSSLVSFDCLVERDHSTRVKSISFHARLPLLVVSYHSGLVQLFDYHHGSSTSGANGGQAGSGNPSLGLLLASMEEHEGPVRAVTFHKDRDLLATGGDDGLVKVWSTNMVTGIGAKSSSNSTAEQSASSSNFSSTVTHIRSMFTLRGHMDYVRSLDFHPTSLPWLVSGSDDHTIRIWNWQSRDCLSVLTGHGHYVMAVKWICTSSADDDAENAFSLGGAAGSSSDFRFNLSLNNPGILLASGSLDGSIRIWDCSGLKHKKSSVAHAYQSSGHVPSSSMTGSPDLFAPQDTQLLGVLEGHSRGINSLDVMSSGRDSGDMFLVSGSDDRTVKLWRYIPSESSGVGAYLQGGGFHTSSSVLPVAPFIEEATLSGHFSNVSSVAFLASPSTQSRLIVSNSEDKTLRIWGPSNTQIMTLKRENERFWCVSTIQNNYGSLIAAGHDSGFLVFRYLNSRRVVVPALLPSASYAMSSSPAAAVSTWLSLDPVSMMLKVVLSNGSTFPLAKLQEPSESSISEISTRLIHLSDGSLLVVFGGCGQVHYYPNMFLASSTGAAVEYMDKVIASLKLNLSGICCSRQHPQEGGELLVGLYTSAASAPGETSSIRLKIMDARCQLIENIPIETSMVTSNADASSIWTLENNIYLIVLGKREKSSAAATALIFDLSQRRIVESLSITSPIFNVLQEAPNGLAAVTVIVTRTKIYQLVEEASGYSLKLMYAASMNESISSAAISGGIVYFCCGDHLCFSIVGPSPNTTVESSLSAQQGASGIICALPPHLAHTLLDMAGEAGAFFLGSGQPEEKAVFMALDLTEALFKRATIFNDLPTMTAYLNDGALIGQSILAFLNQHTKNVSLVLPFLKDEATRYKVALDAGLHDLAHTALLDLEEKERQEHTTSVSLYESNKIAKKFVKPFPSKSLQSYFLALGDAAFAKGKYALARDSYIRTDNQSDKVFNLDLLAGKISLENSSDPTIVKEDVPLKVLKALISEQYHVLAEQSPLLAQFVAALEETPDAFVTDPSVGPLFQQEADLSDYTF